MSSTALFSLNDKTLAVQFAKELIDSGWNIIGSKETVELLQSKDLPVRDVADFTGIKEDYGFPPTLHPKIEYALTEETDEKIYLVYVLPYPFSVGNDVGGRTLLALAVKGNRIPVMTIEDMKKAVSQIKKTGDVSDIFRQELQDKAMFEIANHYASLILNREKFEIFSGNFSCALLNGENPYQIPAIAYESVRNEDNLSLLKFKRVSGEAPCFTNMADADSILNTMTLASEAFRINLGRIPFICIAAKHGNACGLGISCNNQNEAIAKALWGNPRAIWGGEIITNFSIEEEAANALLKSEKREMDYGNKSWMLDVIMAPNYSKEAIAILGKSSSRKLFANIVLLTPEINKNGIKYRQVSGGFLRQPIADYILNIKKCEGENIFSKNEIADLIIAWAVAFSSNHGGNEVAIAKNGTLLGAGGGPSTVDAAKTAVMRAKEWRHDIADASFGADAFFPFIDAPKILIDAGIKYGCAPGGGKHHQAIMDFFNKKSVKVSFIQGEFRGFCRH